MANQEHLDILKQGVEVWNRWREDNRGTMSKVGLNEVIPRDMLNARIKRVLFSKPDLRVPWFNKVDLSNASLRRTNLNGADLRAVDLNGADLNYADLGEADLSWADLRTANFRNANLRMAKLWQADLSGANFSEADLSEAKLTWANLSGAHLNRALLREADLISTNFTNANLTGCSIFGISAWRINVDGAIQKDLVITDRYEPEITVDNLEVAQFIYILLNNKKIRDVINTITSKVVLILGRFTKERTPVLDALRDELRNYNYSPIVFDFDPLVKRDLTETISTLAHLSRFIIADLTDAKSIPQELERIVPHLPSVPIQPILQIGNREYAMFEHYDRYPWVLPLYHYQNIPSLLASLKEHIIKPVEQKEYEKEENKALKEKIRILEEENRKLRGGK